MDGYPDINAGVGFVAFHSTPDGHEIILQTNYLSNVIKPDPTGAAPVGDGDWWMKVLKKHYSNQWSRVVEIKGEFRRSAIPKISGIERGSQLSPERVTRLKIGQMKPKEREILMVLILVIDLFSGYDQISLDAHSVPIAIRPSVVDSPNSGLDRSSASVLQNCRNGDHRYKR